MPSVQQVPSWWILFDLMDERCYLFCLNSPLFSLSLLPPNCQGLFLHSFAFFLSQKLGAWKTVPLNHAHSFTEWQVPFFQLCSPLPSYFLCCWFSVHLIFLMVSFTLLQVPSVAPAPLFSWCGCSGFTFACHRPLKEKHLGRGRTGASCWFLLPFPFLQLFCSCDFLDHEVLLMAWFCVEIFRVVKFFLSLFLGYPDVSWHHNFTGQIYHLLYLLSVLPTHTHTAPHYNASSRRQWF